MNKIKVQLGDWIRFYQENGLMCISKVHFISEEIDQRGRLVCTSHGVTPEEQIFEIRRDRVQEETGE